MKQTIAAEATKASPPVAIAGSTFLMDISLNSWVAIATITYILLQAGYLAWKWYQEYKSSKNK